MEEFTIFVKNAPGQLARICDTLYKNGVNIESVTTEGTRDNYTVIKIITNDVSTTKRALEQAKIPFETKEVLVIKVINRPGELAKVMKRVGAENVNVESIYLLSNDRFAVRVNDMWKAREILKDKLF